MQYVKNKTLRAVAKDKVSRIAALMGYDDDYDALDVLTEFALDKTQPAEFRAACAAKVLPVLYPKARDVPDAEQVDASDEPMRIHLRDRLNELAGEKAQLYLNSVEDAEVVDEAPAAAEPEPEPEPRDNTPTLRRPLLTPEQRAEMDTVEPVSVYGASADERGAVIGRRGSRF